MAGIAVESRDHVAALVEEQKRRRELHAERCGQLLFAHDAAVDPRHFTVAPDVERDGDEMLARFLHDRALRKIGHHQLRAVRTAVLAEIDEHPAPSRAASAMSSRKSRKDCVNQRGMSIACGDGSCARTPVTQCHPSAKPASHVFIIVPIGGIAPPAGTVILRRRQRKSGHGQFRG